MLDCSNTNTYILTQNNILFMIVANLKCIHFNFKHYSLLDCSNTNAYILTQNNILFMIVEAQVHTL